MIVIGYDDSEDARRAIDVAAHRVRSKHVLVVHVCRPPRVPIDTVGVGPGVPLPTVEDEARAQAEGARVLQEAVECAQRAGLDAEPVLRSGEGVRDIADALLDVVDQRGAELVVVGRRGMSRLHTIVLGSVADRVVRQARCPVLVVPEEPEAS